MALTIDRSVAVRPIVALDACVLLPASLRDLLLRAAEADLFQPHWSHQIWEEVTRNLIAMQRMTAMQAARLLIQLEQAFPDAFVYDYEAIITQLACDEKDRHVLAAAIRASASVIVTFNLRHFPFKALAAYGIAAEHPDVFLTRLYLQDAGAMMRLIEQQTADLRHPPLTTNDVLNALALHTPEFVKLTRAKALEQGISEN